MAHSDDHERAAIDLPRVLVTSWLHVVSGFICTRSLGNSWLAHLTKARVLITEGMNAIVQGISSRNILNDSAILPMEIASLLSLRLLQDQVGKADDIIETYSQYLSLLVSETRAYSQGRPRR